MTFVPSNVSPDTLNLISKETLMKFIHKASKEVTDKYAGNMWGYKHKLPYNARHGLRGFIQHAMLGKLFSATPSNYAELH